MEQIDLEVDTLYICKYKNPAVVGELFLLGYREYDGDAIVAFKLGGIPGWPGAPYENHSSDHINVIDKAYLEGRVPGELNEYSFGNCDISEIVLLEIAGKGSLEGILRILKRELK